MVSMAHEYAAFPNMNSKRDTSGKFLFSEIERTTKSFLWQCHKVFFLGGVETTNGGLQYKKSGDIGSFYYIINIALLLLNILRFPVCPLGAPFYPAPFRQLKGSVPRSRLNSPADGL